MIMRHLYTFGSDPADYRANPVLCAQDIRVLWGSWCDVLIAHHHPDNGTEPWHLRYTGTGLSQSQQNFLAEASTISRLGKAIGAEEEGNRVVFFGSTMHHGLRGYVHTQGAEQEITLFATDHEMEHQGHGHGIQEVQVYRMGSCANDSLTITDVKILSDETVLLGLKESVTSKEYLAYVQDIPQLRVWLSSPIPSPSFGRVAAAAAAATLPDVKRAPYDSQDPPQWASNATTTTLLDTHGQVWTSSADARYRACLGRPYDGRSDFGTVPYLSETRVTRVVSGGYMSAALSADGELFMWGQACPGSLGDIDVLKGNTKGVMVRTGIYAEDEQDEFVKCLSVRIDGREAQVHHVAIGHGHVLVAAEAGSGSAKKRAVFAAGDNNRGQLGLEGRPFYGAFQEVEALRGKQVAHLFAVGWSSFVVLREE